MIITPVAVEAILITEVQGLDPIHVFWINLEPGRGYVTAICYGSAWTAYFGGMMGQTIQQFVAGVDVDYLTNKMSTPKMTKVQEAYLSRVVKVIIAAAKRELAAQA